MIDIGFNKFVTLKLVKVLWVLAIVAAALALIGGEIYGLRGTVQNVVVDEFGAPIEGTGAREPVWLVVFLTPIVVAAWLLIARVWFELVAVLFKIADNTAAVARLSTRQDAPHDQALQDSPGRPTETLDNMQGSRPTEIAP